MNDIPSPISATSGEHGAWPARRTLNHLAWGLAAVGLGWLAQDLLARDRLWEGLLLFAIAALLFVTRLGRSPHRAGLPALAAVLPTSRPAAAHQYGRLGWAIAGLGGLLSLAALALFVREANDLAWCLYLASIPLFLAGLWLAESGTLPLSTPAVPADQHPAQPRSRWAWIDPWLIAILLVALFFRLFHFYSLPFGTWYDEAVAGLDARRVLQDDTFRPVFWESMNHPAQHLYLFALAMRLLGDNIQALRLVSVLFGTGTVLAAYLFGRQLGGRRWGLLLAFLMATLRWDVDFSRIAMNGIDAPFFEFLTLYAALRVVRGGRVVSLLAVATVGLFLGLGLCFYTGFRLFAAGFILFGLACVLLAFRSRDRSSALPGGRHLLLSLAVFGLAVWLAVMPVAEFAVTHPQTFWQRTQNVSILRNREDPDLGRALLHSIQKHLLMFNDHGDNNGRHNLPGAPELDQLSAVLFVLGLALALTRRDPAGRFFLWLLPVGLAGGILSLDFEAPQSLRTIAAMPAVVYFVALSLDALWLEMVWAVGIIRPRFSLVPVMLGLGVIAVGNGTTYFVRQAQDTAVWEAFSTAETLVGKQVAAQGADPIYYFSPFLYDHPSIRFHAPAVSPQSVRKVMPLPDPLPARETAGRPVVYFIHPDDVWVFDLARQMYPSAHFETLPHDPDRPPVVYMVRLEPADVASLQGLTVSYWTGEDDTQAPVVTAHSPQVDVDWPGAAPTRLPFVAGWDGVLWVPEYGPYTLAVRAPDQVSLTLDGATSQSSGQLTLTQLLAQGNHYLRLRARGAPGRVQLAWQPPGNEMAPIPAWALYHSPVGAHGLLGKYYASPDWQGSPVMERVDPLLNTYFHLTPLPRPYSVEWSGSLQVPSDGVYSLGLRAVDRAQLYLDGQLTVDAAAPDQYVERMVTLEAGLHEVRVTFQDLTGRSRIHLYWTPPGGEKEILPSVVLWPSQASAKAAPPPATQPPQPVELPVMGLAYRASWGAAGQGDGQFLEPRAVAVISDTVYVADTGNRRVQAWGSDGTFHGAWDGGEEPFEEPLALGVDHQGRLLVLDSLPGWIYRFNAAGEAFDRIAGPTTQTYHPRGMRVLPDDTIAVADTGGGRLVFFDPAGDKVGELGRPGNAPGQLSEPTDVVVDQTGIFYVLEAYSHRLQLLDSSGGSLGSWSIPESVALDGPHMTWAPDGSLLVTAPAQGAILRYAPDGRLLNRWTDAGPLPMQQPVGIYLDDATHTLYVTDTASDQVYVFRLSYP